jgi:hypothetical protein
MDYRVETIEQAMEIGQYYGVMSKYITAENVTEYCDINEISYHDEQDLHTYFYGVQEARAYISNNMEERMVGLQRMTEFDAACLRCENNIIADGSTIETEDAAEILATMSNGNAMMIPVVEPPTTAPSSVVYSPIAMDF